MTPPRTTDVEAIWAEVGTSLERFVHRHVADPHHAEDVVADIRLRRTGAVARRVAPPSDTPRFSRSLTFNPGRTHTVGS